MPHTATGDVLQKPPVIYQQIAGPRKALSGQSCAPGTMKWSSSRGRCRAPRRRDSSVLISFFTLFSISLTCTLTRHVLSNSTQNSAHSSHPAPSALIRFRHEDPHESLFTSVNLSKAHFKETFAGIEASSSSSSKAGCAHQLYGRRSGGASGSGIGEQYDGVDPGTRPDCGQSGFSRPDRQHQRHRRPMRSASAGPPRRPATSRTPTMVHTSCSPAPIPPTPPPTPTR